MDVALSSSLRLLRFDVRLSKLLGDVSVRMHFVCCLRLEGRGVVVQRVVVVRAALMCSRRCCDCVGTNSCSQCVVRLMGERRRINLTRSEYYKAAIPLTIELSCRVSSTVS